MEDEPGADITGLEPVAPVIEVVVVAPLPDGAGLTGGAGLAGATEDPDDVVGDVLPVPTEVAPAEQPTVAAPARASTATQVRGAITFL